MARIIKGFPFLQVDGCFFYQGNLIFLVCRLFHQMETGDDNIRIGAKDFMESVQNIYNAAVRTSGYQNLFSILRDDQVLLMFKGIRDTDTVLLFLFQ